MGRGCEPENLAAIETAEGNRYGQKHTDAELTKDMSPEAVGYYEAHMARVLGVDKRKGNLRSAFDTLKVVDPKKGTTGLMDGQLYKGPKTLFPELYKKSDAWHKAWQKSGGKQEAYKTVVKEAKVVQDKITEVLSSRSKMTTSQIDKALKPYGLNSKNAYEGLHYLDWISKQRIFDETGPIGQTAGFVAKAQANWNLVWTAANVSEFIRIGAHYSANGSEAGLAKGIAEALTKTKGVNIFKQLPELEKQGLYNTVYAERAGNKDPFSWSITAQKNLAYFIDKHTTKRGVEGVNEILFDDNAWSQPRLFRERNANAVFGLARYPINEARWYTGRMTEALTDISKGKVTSPAVKNMVYYHLFKAIIVGSTSLFPSVLWVGLPKEARDYFDKNDPLNVVKKGSKAAFNAVGVDAELDLAPMTQPFGGNLGSRLQSIGSTATAVATNTTKAGVDIFQGKPDAAFIRSVAAALSLANLTGGGIGKVSIPQGINSTTGTNVIETAAKIIEEEMPSDTAARKVAQSLFSERVVRKTDDDNSKDNVVKIDTNLGFKPKKINSSF